MQINQICLNFIVFLIALTLFVALGLVIGGCIMLYEINDQWTTGLAILLIGIILLCLIFAFLFIGWCTKGKQVFTNQNQNQIIDASSISKHIEAITYGRPPSYSESVSENQYWTPNV